MHLIYKLFMGVCGSLCSLITLVVANSCSTSMVWTWATFSG